MLNCSKLSEWYRPIYPPSTFSYSFLYPVLDSSLTFTRAGNAMSFNSSGVLVNAPMNLLTYSGNVAGASWAASQCAVSGSSPILAPDGVTTVYPTVINTATQQHFINQPVTIAAGSLYTYSIYLKAGTWGKAAISFESDNNVNGSVVFVNLSTGILSGGSGFGTGTYINSTISALPNGWYLVSITGTVNPAQTLGRADVFFSGDGISTSAYAGKGTDSFYAYGAQLELTSANSPQSYNPTTASVYYGPRFDYNPSTLALNGLLIEQQSTNAVRTSNMTGAVAGTPGTLPNNWNDYTSVLSRQVVGTGTENGIPYIDYRLFGTAVIGNVNLYMETNNQIVATSGQIWTSSAFIRLVSGSLTNVSAVTLCCDELTAAGVFTAQNSTTITSLLNAPNIAQNRFQTTRTMGATAGYTRPDIVMIFGAGGAVDITLRIGLPQHEQLPFATSPIITTSTAVTRAADFLSNTSIGGFFNAAQGTIFVETITSFPSSVVATEGIFSFNNGSATQKIDNRYSYLTYAGLIAATTSQFNPSTSYTGGTICKAGLSYSASSQAFSLNGSVPTTNGAITLPTGINQLQLGGLDGVSYFPLNGWLRNFSYYNTQLTNAQLQTISGQL